MGSKMQQKMTCNSYRALMPPRHAHEKVQQPNQRIRKSQVRSCSKLSYYKLLTSYKFTPKNHSAKCRINWNFNTHGKITQITSDQVTQNHHFSYLLYLGASSCDVVSGLGCLGWIAYIHHTVFPVFATLQLFEGATWGSVAPPKIQLRLWAKRRWLQNCDSQLDSVYDFLQLQASANGRSTNFANALLNSKAAKACPAGLWLTSLAKICKKFPLCLSLLLSSFLSFKLYQKSCTLEARAQQCLNQSDESEKFFTQTF